MQSIEIEDLISLQRAAALMGVSIATAKRYASAGYHGVVLQTRWIGGRRRTTREWIAEFIEALSTLQGCRAVAGEYSEE